MLLVADQQIQLAVFLDFNAQLIESLNGRVAGKEVLRARSEGDNLQILHADDCTSHRNKVGDHLGNVISRAHGILRNIAVQVPHAQVIGAVQHATVSIATAVDHVAVALGGSNKHAGTVKVLGNQGFGGFGTEVAQENDSSIALGGLQLCYSLQHVLFVFHRGLDFHHVKLLLTALFGNSSTALFT